MGRRNKVILFGSRSIGSILDAGMKKIAVLLGITALIARPGSVLAQGPAAPDRTFAIDAPRLEDVEVRIDGDLSEPVWQNAAVLDNFTQFEPAEGTPASERTEVLVFYTPQALYLGIRAYTRDPSRIRATLAERDKIQRDDNIQILLDTFYDRRRAFSFSVNALGIQQDGMFRGDRVDSNPDFLYSSRGKVTAEGYVVEVRIPFKSLKFPSAASQTWGLNIIRNIAATGAGEAWAPISRSNPSRLAQSGTLVQIRDLRPGRLLQVNPTLTGKREGELRNGHFVRDDFEPDLGGNLKYGLTSNLTLDATINPDFSQIEADADQIAVNERFALFFPEKRPFFLEGADIFATPEPLVYTRRIVDPIAGVKLTGKAGAFNVGYLGALDESPLTGGVASRFAPDTTRALFNIARLQRDIGEGSSLGAVFTDREAGSEFNRVVGVDGRLRFRNAYTWQWQAAGSWTGEWTPAAAGADTVIESSLGHLVQTALDRTGRQWGFRVQMKDVPEDFRASSGFIRRTGVTDFFGVNRFSFFGQPGALLESWGIFLSANRIYGGRDFWQGEAADEGSANLRFNFNLRGNNRIGAGVGRRFFVLDPERYGRYRFVGVDGDTLRGSAAVRPVAELRGLHSVSLEGSSSYWKTVSLHAEIGWEETPIFAEGTRGEQLSLQGGAQLRPTDALRVEAGLRHVRLERAEDGSLYSTATLPRFKAEYQVTRSIALRSVLQYSIEEVDLLRTPLGIPYLGPVYVRRTPLVDGVQTNPLRLDLLFSYQPSPGTVVFLGYARSIQDEGAFRIPSLEPRADGLFVKVSYLFRT